MLKSVGVLPFVAVLRADGVRICVIHICVKRIFKGESSFLTQFQSSHCFGIGFIFIREMRQAQKSPHIAGYVEKGRLSVASELLRLAEHHPAGNMEHR